MRLYTSFFIRFVSLFWDCVSLSFRNSGDSLLILLWLSLHVAYTISKSHDQLELGTANIFYKGPDSNILGSRGHMSLSNHSLNFATKQPQKLCKAIWLWSNNILFVDMEIWILIIFTSWNILLLIFLKQLKVQKTLLVPAGHYLLTPDLEFCCPVWGHSPRVAVDHLKCGQSKWRCSLSV